MTKAHARFLEARLIHAATSAKRANVQNSTSPTPLQLPEADVSDMEYYLSQVQIILPVLGVTEFRPTRLPSSHDHATSPVQDASTRTSPTFQFVVARHGISAQAQEVDGEFTVLEGSTVRAEWVGTARHPGYQQLHTSLMSEGVLQPQGDGLARLVQDIVFASPSAAAAVVSGRAANGRTSWIDVESGITFGDWQSRGISD